MKHIALLLMVGGVMAVVTACSPGHQSAATSRQQVSPSSKTAATQVRIPAVVGVPSGNTLTGSFEGRGQQIYQCTNNSWTLLEPAAIISDHENPIAVHVKGPVWISTIDGSQVSGAPVPNALVQHDDAIPELLLKATENHGTGQFGSVTYIQRLATKGGLAPKSPCTNGIQISEPYSAVYLFYSAS